MSWPAAEVHIDAELVTSLLRAQHADLADRAPVKVAEGFDNSLWRLGDDLVARIPRREIAATLLENELEWLPEVGRDLSLATPLPLRAGVASDLFPWPWLIASWHDGVAGDDLDPAVRGHSAKAMGTFLSQLHREAPRNAPHNPFRSVSLADREESMVSRLVDLSGDVDVKALQLLWLRVRDAPSWDQPKCWIHGDFHPGNTVYRDEALVAVVDFGDFCAGDPATDLAGGLLSLPLDALGDFFDAYGTRDEVLLQRTIGWAILFGLMFTSLGHSDRPSYLGVGRLALANAVELAKVI